MLVPSFKRIGAYVFLLVFVITSPSLVVAQDERSEARLRQIEAEIRALQRQVFPGGDSRFFEPEIMPQRSVQRSRENTPSTSAVTDILARLESIEAQLQRVTAIGEENRNSLTLLTERLELLESLDLQSRINALEQEEARSVEPEIQEEVGVAVSSGSAIEVNTVEESQPEQDPSLQVEEIVGPSEERLAAVREIAKPSSNDAAEDEYIYGFRLWNAGFYPEAQQQLALFVEQYPEHWRASFGRNLLGRALLDDGKAREAASWFLRNYQLDKQAARAGDSLLYLAESMIALDDSARACIALAEFGDTYPALAVGRLQAQYESNRQKVTCN